MLPAPLVRQRWNSRLGSVLLLFLHISYPVPPLLLASFLPHGLQSLQCCTCSSMAYLQATFPLGASLLPGISLPQHRNCSPLRGTCLRYEAPTFKRVFSSCMPNNIPFPVSSTSSFLPKFLQVSLHLSFHTSHPQICSFVSWPQQLSSFLRHIWVAPCAPLSLGNLGWNKLWLFTPVIIPHSPSTVWGHHYWNPAIFTQNIPPFTSVKQIILELLEPKSVVISTFTAMATLTCIPYKLILPDNGNRHWYHVRVHTQLHSLPW